MTSAKNEKAVPDSVKNLITLEDVSFVTHRALNHSNVKVKEYRFTPYSDKELGYFGSHWQLDIVIQVQGEQKNLSLFVKCLPLNCQKQIDFVQEEGIFLEETIFFKDIYPQLIESYCGEKWSPVCYLSKKDILIMENLRDQNYKMHDIFFDKTELLKSALTSVARFHSCSILTEDRFYRESREHNTLGKLYPGSFREKTYTKSGGAVRWLQAGINLAVAVADRLGYNSLRLRQSFDQIFDVVRPSQKYRNVICHGDLWTNNLMFDDAKPIPKCILVDFQFIRYGPMVLDILQLIYLSTTKAYRKENEKELIHFYYSILNETILKNKETAETISPKLHDILDAYEDLRLYGCFIASLQFPIALLDPEIVKENTKDSESYEKFIFGDRTDVTLAYMQKNEFYRRIIEESIGELVEIGNKDSLDSPR
ncbi:hypothetical protein QAD02_016325 [Eretmocerus hayati]|uniref:Uncharacterized protein n=1 Tax=Eretmocerus hayati TaxID=131215 RepID=A0ACC2PBR8_9HYME|nr:hypothetical protein QAD02_016325 [Eretmocerus hayati]